MKLSPLFQRAAWAFMMGILASSCEKSAEKSSANSPSAAKPELMVAIPLDPKAGSIGIQPESGTLGERDALTITFPEDMVAKEAIGKAVVAPVVIDPPMPHTFQWSSPRRGIVRLNIWTKSEITRTVRLRPGLKDLKGEPVQASGWGAEYSSDEFGLVSARFLRAGKGPSDPDADRPLEAMQRVELTFSRNILPVEIARQVSFMDRKTRAKFPVRVALEENQPEAPQGVVVIEPNAPLPPDGDYWLVVERLEESRHGQLLPHLRIYPAGRTHKTAATWARGHNQPRRGPFARIGFSKEMDIAGIKAADFKIQPPVEIRNIETADKEVLLFGDFKTAATYKVSVASGIKALDGSTSQDESTLEITIPEKRAAVILESEHIARQASAGLVVDFQTCRTRSLEWKLARLTDGNFGAVDKRLREFSEFETDNEGAPILDPRDGNVRYHRTEPLIPALNLPVVASGEIAGSASGEEKTKSIRWPAGIASSGTYLLEITGIGADGRTCGNRCLVTLSDWWIRCLDLGQNRMVEIKSMTDAKPVASLEVKSFGYAGKPLPPVTVGADGTAMLPKGTAYFFVGTDGAGVLHRFDSETESAFDEYADQNQHPSATLITDGDVYEPGETVRFFATIRRPDDDGILTIPSDADATLSISSEIPGFEAIDIKLSLDATGSASGAWEIPKTALSGNYFLALNCDGRFRHSRITITDFRLPDFQIDLSAPAVVGDQAGIDIKSSHFHGSPNSGAKVRWTAEWVMNDWRDRESEDEESVELPWASSSFNDRYSPGSSQQGVEGVLSAMRKAGGSDDLAGLAIPASAAERGEGLLDADGRLRITSICPFPAKSRGIRAQVFWIVEVIGQAGESQREAAEQHVQFGREVLAVRAHEQNDGSIRVITHAVDVDDKPGAGISADLEMFRREIHVSKELLGDHLVRYRNAPEFTSVWKKRIKSPGSFNFTPEHPGDYVVVVTPIDMPGALAVSAEIPGLRGSGDSPVLDDFRAEIIADKPVYQTGETASLQIRAPFAGWANVSIETDHVIRTFPPVKLKGDSDRIPLPILPEYFPNVFVRIHLTSDSGNKERPAERLAECELKVVDPRRILTVKPVLSQASPYQPAEMISGQVQILSGNTPVSGAVVTVMAVDDALLSLGDWTPPDPLADFYPDRTHQITAGRALGPEWYSVHRRSLSHSQKGFIIGGGPAYGGGLSARVRENFNPRPLWQTSLRTGAGGMAEFRFKAPDALTTYRVVAFAQEAATAFGVGTCRVSVSKKLRVKPFLPTFLREGDFVQLRCGLEYDGKAPAAASWSVTTSGPVVVEDGAAVNVSLAGGKPGLATANARVQPGSAGKEAVFVFNARVADDCADATRIRVPILPAHILQTQIESGTLAGGESWNALDVIEKMPPSEEFPCEVMLSGSAWLPKLANLQDGSTKTPALADVAANALCTLLKPQLAGYLPHPSGGNSPSNLRDFQKAMDEINASIIQEADFGWLPRWPQGSEPDDMTTAMVAFTINLAKHAAKESAEGEGITGLPIPDELDLALDQWRWSVLDPAARDRAGEISRFVQCMALLLEADGGWSMVSGDKVKAMLHNLYLHRESLDLESKCLLALANHSFRAKVKDSRSQVPGLSDEDATRLIDEVAREDAPLEFNPETLGSRARGEAIRLHTLVQVGRASSEVARSELRRLMKPIRESTRNLNSQENLWMLLAAKSAIELDSPAKLTGLATELGPTCTSDNGVSLGWLGHPAAAMRKYFPAPIQPPFEVTWMVRATHRSPVRAAYGNDSLRVTRGFTNLTERARGGGETAPFEIGDYVLLTYQIEGGQAVHQLQIEEQLPAAMELVNPDLPSVRATFSIPTDDSANQARLSHADRRGSSVSLFFDMLPAGKNQYSVLVRVAGAGTFSWPAAQAAPVYDKRFRATTADQTVHSKAKP